MCLVDFFLQPFQHDAFSLLFKISGSIARNSTKLHLCYELRGSMTELLVPTLSTAPSRRNGLWQNTCFEFFVATKDSLRYWEVNLSPSGDWNVYAFAGYRAGMHEESALITLPFAFQEQADCCCLDLDFPLAKLISPEQPVAVAISAVLQGKNGQQAFYALSHSGKQPDFHQRETFLISL